MLKPKEALALARKRGERGHEAYGLRILGDVMAISAAEESQDAMVNYQGARALAATLGMRPLIATIELRMGRFLARTSQETKARQHIDAAQSLAAEIGMTLWELPASAAKG